MKKLFLTLILPVFLVLPMNEAAAAYESGGTLLEHCLSESLISGIYCMGYILGVADSNAYSNDEKTFCLPKDVSRNQLRLMAVKFLKDNPVTHHYGAASIIVRPWIKAFPCKD